MKKNISFDTLIKRKEDYLLNLFSDIISNNEIFYIECYHGFLIEFIPKLPKEIEDDIIQFITPFEFKGELNEAVVLDDKLKTVSLISEFGFESFESEIIIPLSIISKISCFLRDGTWQNIYIDELISENCFVDYFKNKQSEEKSFQLFKKNKENSLFFKD